jgi:hypothetical protein
MRLVRHTCSAKSLDLNGITRPHGRVSATSTASRRCIGYAALRNRLGAMGHPRQDNELSAIQLLGGARMGGCASTIPAWAIPMTFGHRRSPGLSFGIVVEQADAGPARIWRRSFTARGAGAKPSGRRRQCHENRPFSDFARLRGLGISPADLRAVSR